VLVFVGCMAVMSGLVYLVVDQGFKAVLLRAAGDDLRAIRKAYVTANPSSRGIHESTEMIEDRTLAADAQDRFLLQLGQGRKVAGNMPAMKPREGVFYLPYPEGDSADSTHLVLGRGEFIAPQVYAFVGRDLYEVRRSEHQILLIFAGVLLASIGLAAISGMMISTNFLRRIDAISDTCRAIMAGHLNDRIQTGGTDGELERLAVTINGMLDRIQSLMENLRQVSTDIAHDLRTPLTHLRYSLEKALNEAQTKQDHEEATRQAVVEADQLLDVFAALLRIARIESGARRQEFQLFDLGDLLARAVAMYAPLMEDAHRQLSMTASPGIMARGDCQLVLQLITNLLDNAIRHAPDGTCVTVTAGLQDGHPCLVVADAGPGIPDTEHARVFRRLYRLDQSRASPGNGLGLSMVAAIVDLHEGRISLSNNGPGLRVTVQFPLPG